MTFELSMNKRQGICALDHRPPCYGRYSFTQIDNPSIPPVKSAPFRFNLMRKIGKMCGPTLNEDEPSVRIYISTRERPIKWVLSLLFPRGFFSASFILSFVAQGMALHSQMKGKPVILETIDHSNIRQEYWLKRGVGKTYYEDVWNLEYIFLLTDKTGRTGFHVEERNLEISKAAHSVSPQMTLIDMSFEPVFVLGERHRFSRLFIDIFTSWKYEQRVAISRMETTQEVIDAFVPTWRMATDGKISKERQKFAMDVFIFFFRYHPNFPYLYRQVMGSDTDVNLNKMRGIPNDLQTPISFQFHFQKQISETPTTSDLYSESLSINFYIILFIIFTFFTCSTRLRNSAFGSKENAYLLI